MNTLEDNILKIKTKLIDSLNSYYNVINDVNKNDDEKEKAFVDFKSDIANLINNSNNEIRIVNDMSKLPEISYSLKNYFENFTQEFNNNRDNDWEKFYNDVKLNNIIYDDNTQKYVYNSELNIMPARRVSGGRKQNRKSNKKQNKKQNRKSNRKQNKKKSKKSKSQKKQSKSRK